MASQFTTRLLTVVISASLLGAASAAFTEPLQGPSMQVAASLDLPRPDSSHPALAFSSDARQLLAFGNSVETYDAVSGALLGTLPLAAGTRVASIAADGRTVLLSVPVSATDFRPELLDAATGRTQILPSSWYGSAQNEWDAAMSADGRLISIYSEGEDPVQQMAVTVYDRSTGQRVARRTSAYISAGGVFSGGVTPDGAVEFSNNRVGRKVVDLHTGNLIGMFGFDSIRSSDGRWVVEFPSLGRDESAPADVVVRNGRTAAVLGRLDAQFKDEEIYGRLSGAFCGTSGKVAMARIRDVAVFDMASGQLLAEIPAASWRGPDSYADAPPRVACSFDGRHVAIASGRRVTLHELQ